MECTYQEARTCRLCGSERFVGILDLGTQYVVDFVQKPNDQMLNAPLVLVRCELCGLVQLKHSVSKDRLYKTFWYKSNTSEAMRDALEGIVQSARNVTFVGEGDTVLDIGSNDGTLLGWYPANIKTVGIDPCADLVRESLRRQRLEIGIENYFSKEAVEHHAPFKVITAIAMFYDVEDPVQFLADCKSVLKQDGVLIVQMNYLPFMLENHAVDNICHEHLTYFSMHTFQKAAEKAGLECVGAETNDVNGGSFRIYLTHKDSNLYGISNDEQAKLFIKMMNLLHEEQKAGTESLEVYKQFGSEVTSITSSLQSYLTKQTEAGERIYVYGASTRGTVLLQLLNLADGIILGAAERDQKKIGLHMVGTGTEIFAEEYCREKATQFLVLPWHFRQQIIDRESSWLQRGGRMIFPLPTPYVYCYDGRCRNLLTSKMEVSA